ncbi:degenerin-like protein unc-105 [Macrobrachium nipponense]|uniref:degenerin-like protein unc-105 n=1 Tax=Macrobrachium nipponense TaxID=159736 RepID=UPI0030C7B518
MKCSSHYRKMSHLLRRNASLNTEQQSCDQDVGWYGEELTWSVLCQFGVICDHYGCYDTSLKTYREHAGKPGFLCSKCGGVVDVCWQAHWIDDWNEGRLDNETLSMMLLKQRPDFQDISDLYQPSDEDQMKYATPSDELVYSCSFDDQECDYRWFTTWASDSFGTCYTFNGPRVKDSDGIQPSVPKVKTATSGPKNGLRLSLNVPSGLSLLSPDLGVRVVVHDPRLLALPEEEGVNLGPETSSISISRTAYLRLGPPHGTCQSTEGQVDDGGIHLSTEDSFQNETGWQRLMYSPKVCKQVCVEHEYWKSCQCYVGLSPVYEADEYGTGKPSGRCSNFNITQKLCMDIVTEAYLSGDLDCKCPQACKEMVYKTQVTSSRVNESKSEMVNLHLYLDSTTYELYEESPTYTWDTLLSNLGGSLGLFLGVSLVSVVESRSSQVGREKSFPRMKSIHLDAKAHFPKRN